MNAPRSGSSPPAGISALIVEPEDADRAFLVSTLTSAGLSVTAVDSFSLARSCLMARPPAVLVTELRLGTHNGLHLALLGRSMRTNITLVVVSRHRDRVLERDADAMGAAFVQKPLTKATLLASLCAAALYEPDANGAPDATRPGGKAAPATTARMEAIFDSPVRRHRKARRDIATFLLLETARRRVQ